MADLTEFTAFHLRTFRQDLSGMTSEKTGEAFSEYTVNDYYTEVRCTLRECPELPADTKLELRKRVGVLATQARIERYPPAEFIALRNAARRVLEKTHERISAAYAEALRHGQGDALNPVRAQALYEVLTGGAPQSRAGYSALGPPLAARTQLFMSRDEILAAAVMLACQRGINLSPIALARTPQVHEPGIVQLDMDKPRRGPGSRFWPEILSDDEGNGIATGSDAAHVLMMVAEATEPARVYLEHLGRPTDRLLVRWSNYARQPTIGLAWTSTSWSGSEGHFTRLPPTASECPGAGVTKEPTDHSNNTYLHYVRTDPEALLQRQEEAAKGVQDAMDRARSEVHVKLDEPPVKLLPENDALIVNCADPDHNPVTHKPCTTGFYSFLDCLDCDNAATTARLLPVQLATLRVLEELRGALAKSWEQRFARRYYQLGAMVARHTDAERQRADATADAYVPRVLAALRLEVPH